MSKGDLYQKINGVYVLQGNVGGGGGGDLATMIGGSPVNGTVLMYDNGVWGLMPSFTLNVQTLFLNLWQQQLLTGGVFGNINFDLFTSSLSLLNGSIYTYHDNKYYTPVETGTPANLNLVSTGWTTSATVSDIIIYALIKNLHSSTVVSVSTANTPSWTQISLSDVDPLIATDIGRVGVNLYYYRGSITGSADKLLQWQIVSNYGHGTEVHGILIGAQ